ncbi:MAG: hypothetical protein SP1CHLAM54_16420 [Chlamydiia bacterium]|nr:hypothetical protein [Chlamydiia bacterium]MCH9616531.1 hypothetical protein [Chlamydiia bacterium]MCH9629261.1 hypothetical protein [Chlamydiia bacterium]
MKRLFYLLALPLLLACGYHLDGRETSTLEVPYVTGDLDGDLTDAIVREVALSGKYQLQNKDANYRLKVAIVGDNIYKSGFQYDEEGSTEYNRLVTNEEEKVMTLSVSLIQLSTGKTILGPSEVTARVNYDFIDPDADNEAAVRRRLSSLNFSLGQLDSVEGARASSNIPLHTLLARKIASAL